MYQPRHEWLQTTPNLLAAAEQFKFCTKSKRKRLEHDPKLDEMPF